MELSNKVLNDIRLKGNSKIIYAMIVANYKKNRKMSYSMSDITSFVSDSKYRVKTMIEKLSSMRYLNIKELDNNNITIRPLKHI